MFKFRELTGVASYQCMKIYNPDKEVKICRMSSKVELTCYLTVIFASLTNISIHIT